MSAPPEVDEGNTDAAKLLQFVDKIRRRETPMEKFPDDFIRRDATVRDICKAAIKVFNTTADSPHWEIPCMFNGGGSGLSFLTLFAKQLMREYAQRDPNVFENTGISFERCYRVFFNQCFTLGFESFHQQLEKRMKPTIKLYYKWFVATQLLLPQDEFRIHLPMSDDLVPSMMQWVAQGRKKFNYRTVCAALRRKYNIAKDAQTWILVTHEWMHSLTDYSKLLPPQKGSLLREPIQATLLYQYLMESVKFARVAKEFGINVLNIYGCYCPLNETSLLDGTGYTWAPINMEPLTVEDSVRVLSTKHPDLANQMNNLSFRRMLQHTGCIPKIWSFIEDLIRHKFSVGENDVKNSTFYTHLKEKVENKYGGGHQSNLVLLLALQGWTYGEATNMLPSKPLSHMNYLFYIRTLFTINRQIYVPPILLHSYAERSRQQILITQTIQDSANKMLSGSFTSTDFEDFCVNFYILKRELFVSQGMNKVPITEFFKGAWISPQLQHSELPLANGDNNNNVSIYRASTLEVKSCTSVATTDCGQIDLLDQRPVALFTRNNSHQDGLLLLPDTCIQFKMMFGNSDASLQMVENALDRAERGPLRPQDHRNLFVYITNCRMVDELNDQSAVRLKDSVVISADTFKTAFSPTLDYATSKITCTESNPINEIYDRTDDSNVRNSSNRRVSNKRKKDEHTDKEDGRLKKKIKK